MKELKALVNTYLKANTQRSSLLSEEEKIFAAKGSVLIVDDVEDAKEYWLLIKGSLGAASTEGRALALKSHWTAPSEKEPEDPKAVALEMLDNGKSVSEVSQALGIDRRRIRRWIKKASGE